MNIKLKKISKFLNHTVILNNISLNIFSGEILALLGPSGSGKTTLLRIIAGLEDHDHGHLFFDNNDVTTMNTRHRNVGFVFQSYALFRHMKVIDNIAFGLKMLPRKIRPSKLVIKDKVHQLLNIVQLDNLGNRYPSQLSGGQKQRVALARALALEPKILLLDEPFGALDANIRKELRCWLHDIHKKLKFTGVFVTHDQEDAMEIAHRIAIMNQGKIEQVGSPKEICQFPVNNFILEFINKKSMLMKHNS